MTAAAAARLLRGTPALRAAAMLASAWPVAAAAAAAWLSAASLGCCCGRRLCQHQQTKHPGAHAALMLAEQCLAVPECRCCPAQPRLRRHLRKPLMTLMPPLTRYQRCWRLSCSTPLRRPPVSRHHHLGMLERNKRSHNRAVHVFSLFKPLAGRHACCVAATSGSTLTLASW